MPSPPEGQERATIGFPLAEQFFRGDRIGGHVTPARPHQMPPKKVCPTSSRPRARDHRENRAVPRPGPGQNHFRHKNAGTPLAPTNDALLALNCKSAMS